MSAGAASVLSSGVIWRMETLLEETALHVFQNF
jgi:hypothetical protein